LIAIIYSSNALLYSQEDSITAVSKESAKLIENDFNRRLEVLSEISKRESMSTMNWEIQKEILAPNVKRLEYLDIAVVLPNGIARYVTNGETADLSDRSYIQNALKANQVYQMC